jgi:hypothetical protein
VESSARKAPRAAASTNLKASASAAVIGRERAHSNFVDLRWFPLYNLRFYLPMADDLLGPLGPLGLPAFSGFLASAELP